MNRLISLVMNRFIGRAIAHFANRGKDPAQMTPEEKAQARSSRQTGKRARQGMRLLRRITRL